MECAELRVKDVNFDRGELTIRDGKGGKDRVTMLPSVARPALERQVDRVRLLHEADLRDGAGRVAMPTALDRKAPAWASELAWQWLFPATRRYRDGASGEERRHHLHETVVHCAMQGSPRWQSPTRYDIRSQRICWRMGMTSGRCRSCWVIRMSGRR